MCSVFCFRKCQDAVSGCTQLDRESVTLELRKSGDLVPDPPQLCPERYCLGTPIVYSPVKADLAGNIKKIRAVYESNPTKFKTLKNILEAEKEMYGAAWPKTGATLALMWLKRGLKFIQVLLQSISDGERDDENPNLIRVNALKAYEIALKKYHGWMLQKLFAGSVYALPYKSDLLKALEKGKNVNEEETMEKIHQFLAKATPVLDAVYEMYAKTNAELNYKA
uniref:Glycolipid transfer protein n=1 Tax=Pelodiscus sinensis TaxID=13735 RepID=K7GGT0_PELSI|nr:glycolipid transfer protein [Pelodiscus sinensis]|eukprot:XP_025044059.1 glycolipid transfer protein [Pelodiscus sinensis]